MEVVVLGLMIFLGVEVVVLGLVLGFLVMMVEMVVGLTGVGLTGVEMVVGLMGVEMVVVSSTATGINLLLENKLIFLIRVFFGRTTPVLSSDALLLL
jgi:hypothetical protein